MMEDDILETVEWHEQSAKNEIRAARLPRALQAKRLARARAQILIWIATQDSSGFGPVMTELYRFWRAWHGGGSLLVTTEVVEVGPGIPEPIHSSLWASVVLPWLNGSMPLIQVCPSCGSLFVLQRKDQQACQTEHAQKLRDLKKKIGELDHDAMRREIVAKILATDEGGEHPPGQAQSKPYRVIGKG